MRPMRFFNAMGGMNRKMNETIEKAATGRVDEHRQLQTAGLSLFATQDSMPMAQSFESVGTKLRDEMNTSKQVR